MEMSKKERSFIEFANNAPPENEPVILEKTAIPGSGGPERFAEELVRLKGAAIESIRQKEVVDKNIEIHKRLVSLLSSIIEKGKVEDGEDSRFILHICNTHPNMTYALKNGKVVKDSGYLMEKTSYAIRDLFEFLSDSKKIKKIKKCPICSLFFLAKDTKKKICYGTSCRNEYHKADMKKRRDDDPTRYC
jgi:hypothetical protein